MHYYTTSASRVDPSNISVLDQSELEKQLPAMQELFAEAFVQLQQELSEESARSFAANQHDPLAILHDLNKKKSRKPPPKPASQKKKGDQNGGGFLRDVPVPERLRRTQQQQAQQQKELIQRMNQASSSSSATKKPDISRRRKSSRKSIWNVVMEQQHNDGSRKVAPIDDSSSRAAQQHGMECSCGSSNVELLESHTSRRNQEMAKQETWGSKDRNDEVMVRYRCLTCGKTWNEEE